MIHIPSRWSQNFLLRGFLFQINVYIYLYINQLLIQIPPDLSQHFLLYCYVAFLFEINFRTNQPIIAQIPGHQLDQKLGQIQFGIGMIQVAFHWSRTSIPGIFVSRLTLRPGLRQAYPFLSPFFPAEQPRIGVNLFFRRFAFSRWLFRVFEGFEFFLVSCLVFELFNFRLVDVSRLRLLFFGADKPVRRLLFDDAFDRIDFELPAINFNMSSS